MLFSLIGLSLILIALCLLVILAIIDFRTYYLPNIYVFPFAIAGVLFHLATQASIISPVFIAAGALVGFFSLYLIRLIANYYYKKDTLGLGDVKLMGAAGIWLGLDGILIALTIGSLAGMAHGIVYGLCLKHKTKKPVNFGQLNIPAGPGFIIGIILASIPLYKNAVVNMIATIF